MSAGLEQLASAIGAQAQGATDGVAMPAFGIVTSYDPENFLAKVKLQPPPADGQAVESGWLPLLCAQIGNGWGIYSPPALGDQVIVIFADGDYQTGVIMGGVPNDEDKAPTVPSGEIWLAHKSGSFIKLTSNGEIASKGLWKHDGALEVAGDITDNAPGNGVTVKELRDAYNAHKHQVITTGAPSGPTDHLAT